MYQHVRNLGTPLDRFYLPWYQPCATRGYSKFYDQESDPDRALQFEVTDGYLAALEKAFHQGQFDAGITNVEDTSRNVFDFLAENCVETTEAAYRLGRAQKDMDPGGSVDPGYMDPSVNTPGAIPTTPVKQDMSVVYGVNNPSGQPAQPSGGGTTPWSPQPSGGTFGPSPLASGFAGGGGTAGGAVMGSTAGGGINWMLVLLAAGAAWFLLRGDRS